MISVMQSVDLTRGNLKIGIDMAEEAEKGGEYGEMLRMTVNIVAAYVANNPLPVTQISEIISSVFHSLRGLSGGVVGAMSEAPKPAVPVRRSVTPEYLICLEDGKKLKMLKRHLRAAYNMTPDEYRAKWGLPIDYPMVAPNYAAQRSDFAKKIGLGRKPGQRPGRRRGDA
jgi:predicted transcriptional regulator